MTSCVVLSDGLELVNVADTGPRCLRRKADQRKVQVVQGRDMSVLASTLHVDSMWDQLGRLTAKWTMESQKQSLVKPWSCQGLLETEPNLSHPFFFSCRPWHKSRHAFVSQCIAGLSANSVQRSIRFPMFLKEVTKTPLVPTGPPCCPFSRRQSHLVFRHAR